jgi:two-component system, chemotaxis family, protein-glutamate methylesterase/glutaminase
MSGVCVRIRVASDPVAPGVWFAPDDAHLVVTESMRFGLDRETQAAHRPSVDSLLMSLAQSLTSEAVGVVLTGMGKDGAEGAAAIRRAGGLVIVQDEASSVVYGMPSAVAQDGADLTLSPATSGTPSTPYDLLARARERRERGAFERRGAGRA